MEDQKPNIKEGMTDEKAIPLNGTIKDDQELNHQRLEDQLKEGNLKGCNSGFIAKIKVVEINHIKDCGTDGTQATA
ncbi:hypothetical protein QJS04_geneDACA019358 [Acorus gramineus]|uniref:Uncharacterized protein n=1 Tax=Acorus gramineus TaxID=55184 RepID=A0AAV9AS75_ACOGR|nr:hypothetical protein QJS04_geneDACA019358 [Acorus gramineus]